MFSINFLDDVDLSSISRILSIHHVLPLPLPSQAKPFGHIPHVGSSLTHRLHVDPHNITTAGRPPIYRLLHDTSPHKPYTLQSRKSRSCNPSRRFNLTRGFRKEKTRASQDLPHLTPPLVHTFFALHIRTAARAPYRPPAVSVRHAPDRAPSANHRQAI